MGEEITAPALLSDVLSVCRDYLDIFDINFGLLAGQQFAITDEELDNQTQGCRRIARKCFEWHSTTIYVQTRQISTLECA